MIGNHGIFSTHDTGNAYCFFCITDHQYIFIQLTFLSVQRHKFFTCGCTALLDAVGGAIHHIGNIHKYARREGVPEKTMFIITTDGYENASRRSNYETVRRMIERQKEKYGWEFLFLGANIDAAKEATRFGIDADRAVNYKCDEEGTALNYEVISAAVCSVRAAQPLSADWKRRIDEDVKKRGR